MKTKNAGWKKRLKLSNASHLQLVANDKTHVVNFNNWSDLTGRNFEDIYSLEELITNLMIYVMTDSFASAVMYYPDVIKDNMCIFALRFLQLMPPSPVTVYYLARHRTLLSVVIIFNAGQPCQRRTLCSNGTTWMACERLSRMGPITKSHFAKLTPYWWHSDDNFDQSIWNVTNSSLIFTLHRSPSKNYYVQAVNTDNLINEIRLLATSCHSKRLQRGPHTPTAINRQYLAGNITGIITDQKMYRRSNFLRLTNSTKRCKNTGIFTHHLRRFSHCHGGINNARANTIYPNITRSQLNRRSLS